MFTLVHRLHTTEAIRFRFPTRGTALTLVRPVLVVLTLVVADPSLARLQDNRTRVLENRTRIIWSDASLATVGCGPTTTSALAVIGAVVFVNAFIKL